MTTVFRERAEETTRRIADWLSKGGPEHKAAEEIEALCVQVHNEAVEKCVSQIPKGFREARAEMSALKLPE